jgi:hypothetical protein
MKPVVSSDRRNKAPRAGAMKSLVFPWGVQPDPSNLAGQLCWQLFNAYVSMVLAINVGYYTSRSKLVNCPKTQEVSDKCPKPFYY